jgi:sec-independent protein translocase protein TatA
MFAVATGLVMLGDLIGGWELLLIVAVVLILFGAKRLQDIRKGFGDGLHHFRKEMDNQAEQAGRSLGGIYGRPAAQALTPDNQNAELYDPAALQDENKKTIMSRDAKQRLSLKIKVATILMWTCLAASTGPVLYAIYRIIASSGQPEGGFEGMAIMFLLITYGAILLFPLWGFVEAKSWRLKLLEQMRKLEASGSPIQ